MRLAMIGLGRMGGNIARRLMQAGHEIVAFDRNAESVAALAADGATGVASLEELMAALQPPRIVWVMLPAGDPTEATVKQLCELAQPGDVVIDGGNSFYKDDVRRARECAECGVDYVDVGTSGGVWGLERGYCMMIGGPKPVVDMLDPVFDALAPGYGSVPRTEGRGARDGRAERGYIHVGPAGSGHFVKMVHNGIEYGLMQAYAEGFDILKGRASDKLPEAERFDIDLTDVAEVWRRGSVISSWLLDLCAIEVIESAIAGVSDAQRPLARMMLLKSIAVNRMRISIAGSRVGITYDDKAPIVVWIGGDPVKWKLIEVLVFDVSAKADGEAISLTFRGKDSERTTTYRSVGQDLVVDTTIISPLLSTPIVYKQIFDRTN